MSTIEDKILDGPRVHYCEADDDDVRHEDEGQTDEFSDQAQRNDASSLFVRPTDEDRLSRCEQVRWRACGSTNTGPKGVIEDYKEQLLAKEKQNKKLSDEGIDDLEEEFQALLNDDTILKEYIAKRISDSVNSNIPIFGVVQCLKTGEELLDAIDKENPNVLVVVHIYTKFSRPCANLNRCLNDLARELKHIKFVTLDASVTNLSSNFKENGVPALIAYRGGDLVKSIVQLEELLDKDFDTEQVQDLLRDNNMIS